MPNKVNGTEHKLVGKNYPTPDLYAKVTGQSKYAEDFRANGMLFCKLLLSTIPHARVKNIDASAALAMPGVKAILTQDDLPAPADSRTDNGEVIKANKRAERALTMEPLYEGEPILAVAAVDELTAAEAIEKIKITYERLPFVGDLDFLDGLGGGQLVDGGHGQDRLAFIERLHREGALGAFVGLDDLAVVGSAVGGRGEIVLGEDRLHAGHRQRGAGVDVLDARVRYGAEQQLAEQHTVGAEILGVLGLPRNLRVQVRRRVVLADQLVFGPVHFIRHGSLSSGSRRPSSWR